MVRALAWKPRSVSNHIRELLRQVHIGHLQGTRDQSRIRQSTLPWA